MSPRCFYWKTLENGDEGMGSSVTYCYSLNAPAHLDGKVGGRVIGTLAFLDLGRRLDAIGRLLGE